MADVTRGMLINVRTRFSSSGISPYAYATGGGFRANLSRLFQGVRVPMPIEPMWATTGGRMATTAQFDQQMAQIISQRGVIARRLSAAQAAGERLKGGPGAYAGAGISTPAAMSAYQRDIMMGATAPGLAQQFTANTARMRAVQAAEVARQQALNDLYQIRGGYSSQILQNALATVNAEERNKLTQQAILDIQKGQLATVRNARGDLVYADQRTRMDWRGLGLAAGHIGGYVALGMGGAALGSALMYGQFQSQMNRVRSHMRITQQEFNQMTGFVQDYASQTGQNMQDLAMAFMYGKSHGYSYQQATNLVRQATMFGAPYGMTSQDAARMISGITAGFGMGPNQLGTVSNVLMRAGQLSSYGVQQFAVGAPTVSSIASAFGGQQALVQILAAAAALSATGLPSSQVWTQIRNLLVHIALPTTATRTELATIRSQYGVNLAPYFSIQGFRKYGLTGILDAVRQAGQIGVPMGDLAKLVPNLRGTTGLLALVGNQSGRMNSILRQLSQTQQQNNQTQQQFNRYLGLSSTAYKQLRESFLALGQEVGRDFTPTLVAAARDITGVLRGLRQHLGGGLLSGLIVGIGSVGAGLWAMSRAIKFVDWARDSRTIASIISNLGRFGKTGILGRLGGSVLGDMGAGALSILGLRFVLEHAFAGQTKPTSWTAQLTGDERAFFGALRRGGTGPGASWGLVAAYLQKVPLDLGAWLDVLRAGGPGAIRRFMRGMRGAGPQGRDIYTQMMIAMTQPGGGGTAYWMNTTDRATRDLGKMFDQSRHHVRLHLAAVDLDRVAIQKHAGAITALGAATRAETALSQKIWSLFQGMRVQDMQKGQLKVYQSLEDALFKDIYRVAMANIAQRAAHLRTRYGTGKLTPAEYNAGMATISQEKWAAWLRYQHSVQNLARAIDRQGIRIPVNQLRASDRTIAQQIGNITRAWDHFKTTGASTQALTNWYNAMLRAAQLREKLYDNEAKIALDEGLMSQKEYQARVWADHLQEQATMRYLRNRLQHAASVSSPYSRHPVPVYISGHCAAEERNEVHQRNIHKTLKEISHHMGPASRTNEVLTRLTNVLERLDRRQAHQATAAPKTAHDPTGRHLVVGGGLPALTRT
jgi:TP901 family phage tail tape measure protein